MRGCVRRSRAILAAAVLIAAALPAASQPTGAAPRRVVSMNLCSDQLAMMLAEALELTCATENTAACGLLFQLPDLPDEPVTASVSDEGGAG